MWQCVKFLFIVIGGGYFDRLRFIFYYRKYCRLGIKLGYSIGYDVFGYGLKLPHYGTIVIGGNNRIGNYAVLHTSTCVTDNTHTIGDGLYLSTGAIITCGGNMGSGISICANSLVNKYIEGDYLLVGGTPAYRIRETPIWYVRDGYESRVNKVEYLKKKLSIYEDPTE